MRRRDLFARTRQNIVLASLGIVMIGLVAFALVTLGLFSGQLYRSVDQQLQTHRNMTITEMKVAYDGGTVREVVMPVPLAQDLISLVWQGDTLVKDSPHAYKGSDATPNLSAITLGEIGTIRDGDYQYRAVEFEVKGLTVQLLLNINEQANSIKALCIALIRAGLIIGVIVIALGYALATITLRPLRRTYEKQVAFIQDASHEMRTPLAVIKGRLELLVRKPEDSIMQHYEEMAGIMSELRGLEKLNSDLLLMSKEDVAGKLTLEDVSINTFMESIYPMYEALAEAQKKHFEYQRVPEDMMAKWDLEIGRAHV